MRRPVNPHAGDGLLHWIWEELPPYAERYMDATFNGRDPSAASSLVYTAPNEWRGLIALCAYWIGLPNPAYREIVGAVWDHDHWHMMKAARGGGPQVRRMMMAAEFPIPMSGAVTVYRGTFNMDPATAVKGLAWTTSHATACWFACEFHSQPGSDPLVLKATVDASELIYWSNDRNEDEVILRRPPAIEVDEYSGCWAEIASRLSEERHTEMKAKLEHLANRGAR